jgi:hypothetical protein
MRGALQIEHLVDLALETTGLDRDAALETIEPAGHLTPYFNLYFTYFTLETFERELGVLPLLDKGIPDLVEAPVDGRRQRVELALDHISPVGRESGFVALVHVSASLPSSEWCALRWQLLQRVRPELGRHPTVSPSQPLADRALAAWRKQA